MTDVVPWVKWHFDRWRNDEGLRMCSLSARGLWVELLALMHGGRPYGHLAINGRSPSHKQVASLVGMTTEKEVIILMQELEYAGVFSQSEDGLIYCRRMVRDNILREKGKAYGALGGNPNITPEARKQVNGFGQLGLTLPVKIEKKERERREDREGDGVTPLPPPVVQKATEIWNHVCGSVCGTVRKLPETRRRKLATRLREDFGDDLEKWRGYCQTILASSFLSGGNDRGWTADFDWAIKPENSVKVLEGRYKNKSPIGSSAPLANGYIPATTTGGF